MTKLFVWDFHGTLERGSELGFMRLLNAALEQCGYTERFTPEHAQLLHGKNSYHHLEYLLPQEFPERRIAVQERAYHLFDRRPDDFMQEVQPTPYAHQVLKRIKEKQQDQILISNCRPQALDLYLQHTTLKPFFSRRKTFGLVREPPKNKQEVLDAYVKRHPIYNSVVCIGDSVPDVSLTALCPVTSYLHAHPGRPFRHCKADFRIDDLREVLREI